MMKRCFLKTLLILSLSTIFVLTLPAAGICIDKIRIDLSEYRGIGNRTFIAYKYAFGVRNEGTLRTVITDLPPTGFTMAWNEEYPSPGPGGVATALYLAFDYEVTGEGLYERNTQRYAVLNDGSGNLSRGDLLYKFVYRDPWGTLGLDGTMGNPHPLLTFPYAVVDVGYMWGDAFIEKAARADIYNPRVYQFTLLGLEDVTVPAGTFTDCVKIARFRGNQADRIAWYAKGIGAVKMILAQEEHRHSSHSTEGYPLELRVEGYNRAFVLQSLDN